MSVLKSNREKSARSNLVTTLSALIRHRAEDNLPRYLMTFADEAVADFDVPFDNDFPNVASFGEAVESATFGREIDGVTTGWTRGTCRAAVRHLGDGPAYHMAEVEGAYLRGPVAVCRWFGSTSVGLPQDRIVESKADGAGVRSAQGDGWVVIWRPLAGIISMPLKTLAEAKRFAAGMATQMSPDGLVYRPDAARSILLGQASDTE